MKKYLIPSCLFILSAASLWACDSCGCEFCEPSGLFSTAVFGANAAAPAAPSYFFTDLVEQYTDFGTLKNVPAGVSTDQWENSFITQFIFGYQINPDLNVQLNIPYVYRSYQIENLAGSLSRGEVNGLGDIRLVANYIAFHKETADADFSWRVSGGVKLPTGDAHLLAQEDASAPPSDLNGPNSATGGHDLALGSGSTDGILATGITYNRQRFLFTADVDYTIRGTGYAGYRYSNELGWSGGPGYRVWQDANHALSLQFLASGEYKAADTVQGASTNDTFVSSVLLGPNVLFAWNKVLTAHLQLEIPVMLHYDTGFQAIPTFRLKAGVTFSF
jgi:hypothetical protein